MPIRKKSGNLFNDPRIIQITLFLDDDYFRCNQVDGHVRDNSDMKEKFKGNLPKSLERKGPMLKYPKSSSNPETTLICEMSLAGKTGSFLNYNILQYFLNFTSFIEPAILFIIILFIEEIIL